VIIDRRTMLMIDCYNLVSYSKLVLDLILIYIWISMNLARAIEDTLQVNKHT
jgi:hypothetical protein